MYVRKSTAQPDIGTQLLRPALRAACALARHGRNDVGRVHAGLHEARDVGADPQMRVVTNPARVDARGGAVILRMRLIQSRVPDAMQHLVLLR